MPKESAHTRFAKFCKRAENGCLEWTGHISPDGRGRFSLRLKTTSAHRAAWLLAMGPIPEGKLVCHRCDNPKCVDVKHLFLGTYQDNFDDMMRKGRGRAALGVETGHAKLSSATVLEIRALREQGRSYCSMAKDYGVSRETVRRASKGIDWRHVAP